MDLKGDKDVLGFVSISATRIELPHVWSEERKEGEPKQKGLDVFQEYAWNIDIPVGDEMPDFLCNTIQDQIHICEEAEVGSKEDEEEEILGDPDEYHLEHCDYCCYFSELIGTPVFEERDQNSPEPEERSEEEEDKYCDEVVARQRDIRTISFNLMDYYLVKFELSDALKLEPITYGMLVYLCSIAVILLQKQETNEDMPLKEDLRFSGRSEFLLTEDENGNKTNLHCVFNLESVVNDSDKEDECDSEDEDV